MSYYDSTRDTLTHIGHVGANIERCVSDLLARAARHDTTKLAEPEKGIFDEFTPKLKDSEFGSKEYNGFLKGMSAGLEHHYRYNSHHPEHYRWHCPICELSINDQDYVNSPQGPNDTGVRYCPQCCKRGMIYESELMLKPELGINGMDLLDIIEMLCDWKAATLRHTTGGLRKSIDINVKRYHISPEMKRLLIRTAERLRFLDN